MISDIEAILRKQDNYQIVGTGNFKAVQFINFDSDQLYPLIEDRLFFQKTDILVDYIVRSNILEECSLDQICRTFKWICQFLTPRYIAKFIQQTLSKVWIDKTKNYCYITLFIRLFEDQDENFQGEVLYYFLEYESEVPIRNFLMQFLESDTLEDLTEDELCYFIKVITTKLSTSTYTALTLYSCIPYSDSDSESDWEMDSLKE